MGEGWIDVRPVGEDDLALRAEVRDVMQRYVRAIDRVDLPAVLETFHPGAWDDHGQFRGTAEDFVAWLGTRLGRHLSTTHLLSVPLVRRVADDVAQVDTTCIVHRMSPARDDGHHTMSVGALRYLDRFERRDGRWRVAHRVVVHDWNYEVETSTGQPFPPGYLVGRRDHEDASYADVEPSGEPVG